MSKCIVVGTFPLGHENTILYGNLDSSGGYFNLMPKSNGQPQVFVGFRNDKWPEIVSVLLHETMEVLMLRAGVAYHPIGCLSESCQDRVFTFSHVQFDEMCEKQAFFLAQALPQLHKYWKEQQRKWKKNKRNAPKGGAR